MPSDRHRRYARRGCRARAHSLRAAKAGPLGRHGAWCWPRLSLFPLVFTNPAVTSIGVFTMIYLVAACGWNIFSGYSGYISIGHAAYYGIGQYTVALVAMHLKVPAGWDTFALLPLAGVVVRRSRRADRVPAVAGPQAHVHRAHHRGHVHPAVAGVQPDLLDERVGWPGDVQSPPGRAPTSTSPSTTWGWLAPWWRARCRGSCAGPSTGWGCCRSGTTRTAPAASASMPPGPS